MAGASSKMRRLIIGGLVGILISTAAAAAVRSDRFSHDPLKLKVPGQELAEEETSITSAETLPAQAAPERSDFVPKNDSSSVAPPIIEDAAENAAAAEAEEASAATPISLDKDLDAEPTPGMAAEEPPAASTPPALSPEDLSLAGNADEVTPTPAVTPEDEFDQGVAQYKKTPSYLENAFREKDRFIFMSGNDNFLHGGYVALFGRDHVSSGDDEGRTLSLEAEYFYQAPYAEWHFSLETLGISQLDYADNGRVRYTPEGKTKQFFLERDRVVVDLRRRHQYGTVYWLGGLLLEYWTDRGFLAKPIQKKWHKIFERQGTVQYYNLDRGVDETAVGTRSGLGLKELWNTAAYWDNILQGEIVLEQMFSHAKRGSVGWRLDYTMTSGTWGGRNLSNPRLSLQLWGIYRRLFNGVDESQGGVNLIYGLESSKEKKVWRIILGVNFNREWEDRAYGKYDADHAFWYLGVDVINFE